VTRLTDVRPANDAANSRAGGKRQAQASRRRELLLEAALALFAERGYRGTSVRDITRRAGVTEAVLYHYFANKVDLWTAVLTAYAPFSRVGEVLAETAEAPVEEALRRLGYELLLLLRAREQLVLTLLSEAPAEVDVAAALERFVQSVTAALGDFLAVRQARGEIAPDVDVLAAARAFQGALLVRFLTTSLAPPAADAESDREMVDGLAEALVRGLAPRDAA
jgi:AcrR family transcriptional regulator